MKDPLNRTKVVIRHLPPSISQSALMEQIDVRFSGRYSWFSFRPGKISQKNLRHSRAYIDFQSPEGVIEFAEFFDGHIFVNEKGSQFKALVEYAPSQRVLDLPLKKDGRAGTIYKDPDYVQFLEFIGKPVENLPSAEIQLERREAERAGGQKEAVIVTPLMDFIRQKRAAKNGYQRSSANGKLGRRAGGGLVSTASSSKRGSEKRKGPSSVYVLRDSAKSRNGGKDKPTYMLMSRKEGKQLATASRTEAEDITGAGSNGAIPIAPEILEIGNKRVVLSRERERQRTHMLGGSSQQQNAMASVRNISNSSSNHSRRRQDASVRTKLSSKDTRQNQTYLPGIQPEKQIQEVNFDKDKRPPRPPNSRLIRNDHLTKISTNSSLTYKDGARSQDVKSAINNPHGSAVVADKNEKQMRSKDRPDRGVWTPRCSDGVPLSKDPYLSGHQSSYSIEGISTSLQIVGNKNGDDCMGFQRTNGDHGCNSSATYDARLSYEERNSDVANLDRHAKSQSEHANISSAENGTHRFVGRHGSAHLMKEVEGCLTFSEGKASKRGVSAGHSSHERQVWVQKLGSGS